jgi:hypothetical protein
MTFDILPQVDTTETEVFDSETAALYIADGITSGNIVDLHSCVEYLNTYSTTPINGSMCEGLLKNAIKVLKQQLIDVDEFAKSGDSVWSVEYMTEHDEDMFSISDIIDYKIDIYGSEEAWLTALRFNAEA